VEDGRAVLEATRTEAALLAGICDGGGWALMLAATQPATALGVAAIAPCLPRLTPSHPNYRRYPSLEPFDTDEGSANRAFQNRPQGRGPGRVQASLQRP
jgi:pimeloyl-ACP methyl ester carboxylesterase